MPEHFIKSLDELDVKSVKANDSIFEIGKSIVHIYTVIGILKDSDIAKEAVHFSLTSHTFTYKNLILKLIAVQKLEPMLLFHS